MKKLTESAVWIIILLSVTLFTGCETYRYGAQSPQTFVENPPWAPPYYPGVRYYYFPDIECYYDLYDREFIFLDHAQWIYSPTLPYMYNDFDLNNGFVVIVNSNIYQPWMHHQYYVSHFPRYYYRDYYDHSNIPWVRGYDENYKRALYWNENERNRARSWDDENLRQNRKFRYSREDRLQQNQAYRQGNNRYTNNNEQGNYNPGNNAGNNPNPSGNQGNNTVNRPPQRENNPVIQPSGTENSPRQRPAASPETRRTDQTNYYGKPIGQPVKVERQMRERSETGGSEGSENNRGDTRTRSNPGRR